MLMTAEQSMKQQRSIGHQVGFGNQSAIGQINGQGVEPAVPSEVGREIDVMANTIGSLAAYVGDLERKLSPVLLPAEPSSNGISDYCAEPTGSAVGAHIQNQRIELAGIIGAIRGLTKRLAV